YVAVKSSGADNLIPGKQSRCQGAANTGIQRPARVKEMFLHIINEVLLKQIVRLTSRIQAVTIISLLTSFSVIAFDIAVIQSDSTAIYFIFDRTRRAVKLACNSTHGIAFFAQSLDFNSVFKRKMLAFSMSVCDRM